MRILIADDNPELVHSLQQLFLSENFIVDTTNSGDEALMCSKLFNHSIIVMDLTLSGMSGYAALRRMRAENVNTPVIVLSALSSIEDKVRALAFGADDYMTKPFHKDELVARIHAVIRRSKGHEESIVTVGELSMNLYSHTLIAFGKRIKLTPKEELVAELLFVNKGQTITRSQLNEHIYGKNSPHPAKCVDIFVCSLRKKLLKMAGTDQYITTIWREGYALNNPTLALQGEI